MTISAPIAPEATAPDSTTMHGRNHITTRALKQVVAAVTAETMGVPARQVGVQLGDAAGLLQVTATATIAVPDLTAPRRAGEVTDSIIARATAAQAAIRDQILLLTGSTVGRVTLRLNDAHIVTRDGLARSGSARDRAIRDRVTDVSTAGA